MRARASRYTGILLVLGSLALPVHSAPSPQVQSSPTPFLQSAAAEAIAERHLSSIRVRLPEVAATAPAPSGGVTAAPPSAAAKQGASNASGTTRRAKPGASVTVIVREGQSVWALAVQYGTSVEAIVAANGLRSAELIRAGQRLVIPGKAAAAAARKRPAAGTRMVTIRLREGQTLWDLSQAYGVTVEEIAEANQLRRPDVVRAGQRLTVPARATAVTRRRVSSTGAHPAVESATSAVRLAQALLWPARGRLTSRFGWRRWRHHDGIDIAASRGAPITAALDGVVTFAGWYYSYGRTVIIDHGNGLQTRYGHAASLLVRPGQKVTKGQLIARVGSTGRSTGPHVHFEVRINGRAVNPMKYL